MADDDFRRALAVGRQWEVAVAAWLKSRGWYLMPDYASLNQGGAPKLTGDGSGVVLPDLLGATGGVMRYVEVKYRTHSVEMRITGKTVTGKIAQRVWDDYLRIEAATGIPVWLVFVQREERELVGQHIKHIARFSNRGTGRGAGFVYVEYECLDRMASFADIERFVAHGERCVCAECFEHKAAATKRPEQKCRSCGTAGQGETITAPSFVGPLHLCVPCFRREWNAGRTPAWGSEHPTRCTCAVCFEKKLAAGKAAR